jgi:hypothetical protein
MGIRIVRKRCGSSAKITLYRREKTAKEKVECV